MLSEEISQERLRTPPSCLPITLQLRSSVIGRGPHTWPRHPSGKYYSECSTWLLQVFFPACLFIGYTQVNCESDIKTDRSPSLYWCGGNIPGLIWWAASMDPHEQPGPLLQLHGNSFAMSSGQVPKLRAGYNERGGGGGEGEEHNQQILTSCAGVSSRLNPGEQFQNPLETVVHCRAKGRLDVRGRGPRTICRSGVMFPWMHPRTTDSEQSGNCAFLYYLSLCKATELSTKYCWHNLWRGWIHTCRFNELPPSPSPLLSVHWNSDIQSFECTLLGNFP